MIRVAVTPEVPIACREWPTVQTCWNNPSACKYTSLQLLYDYDAVEVIPICAGNTDLRFKFTREAKVGVEYVSTEFSTGSRMWQ